MARRNPTLLKRLRLQLNGARRVYSQRGETGPQKNGFEERPWRGDDALILRYGFERVDVRYILREAESRKVRRTWTVVLTSTRPEELYDWLTTLR
jgi:hypothetical protein